MEISNDQTEKWINKSSEQINRFTNYIILISKYEKEPIDKFTLSSIHESLASSSVSIAFSIFNIFALITGTEASFFDDHIKDYFNSKVNLKSEEMNLLSFKWHTSIQSINSLGYSIDETFCVYKVHGIISFKILKMKTNELSNRSIKSKENCMNYSKEYFLVHFLYLLTTIKLIINLLSREKMNSMMLATDRKYSYLKIENISELMTLYKDRMLLK
jgi:hypothetical protein